MREKMVTDRDTRVMAHKDFPKMRLGPVKRCAHRHFRRGARHELRQIMLNADFDNYSGFHLGHRLNGFDLA